MLSKLLVASTVACALSSASLVTANPSSASKCDLWSAGDSYGPHQKQTIGTTGGNAVTIAGAASYTPNTPVTLTIGTAGTFQGFQIYATDSTGRRVGKFDTTGTNSAGLVNDQGCSGDNPAKPNVAGSTFSHNSSAPKPANMQLKWIPDPTAVGTVSFTATVMPNSGPFYQAKVATLPRAAGAPAPVAVVDPNAPIAVPVVVAPPVQQQPVPVVGPVQTTPTNGQLTIQGLGQAEVFNPYLKPKPQPVVVVAPGNPSAGVPVIGVGGQIGGGAGAGAGSVPVSGGSAGSGAGQQAVFGVFDDGQGQGGQASQIVQGGKYVSTTYNPRSKKNSAATVSAVVAVSVAAFSAIALLF